MAAMIIIVDVDRSLVVSLSDNERHGESVVASKGGFSPPLMVLVLCTKP